MDRIEGWSQRSVNDHQLKAGRFGLRLKAGLIGHVADFESADSDATLNVMIYQSRKSLIPKNRTTA
jgi:hypothetical protein